MSEFEKVVGYEGIKLELQRICDVLKNTEKYRKLGVHVPKGVMITGDPGLGKTLMANCFINESGCKAYTVRKDKPNGDFVKCIKDTYEEAKKESMSIVFLDDIDKFANEDSEHRDAEEYVTVQACIDECTGNNVFTLATANDPRRLPDSLTRAGRFDKVIEIERPKGETARKIIKHFLKDKKVIGDIEVEEIARYFEADSCAEIEMMINEAGIYAGFENRDQIERKDILQALLRDRFGAPLSDPSEEVIDPREIAVHEAGHAVVYEILEPGAVSVVSIQHKGGSTKGITISGNMDSKSVQYDEHRIARALGGKAAVEIVYGKADYGCSSDIRSAYRYADFLLDDICAYGFDTFVRRNEASQDLFSNKDKKIQTTIEKQYNLAKKIIIENRPFFDAIVEELLKKETITYKDIARIRKKVEKVVLKKKREIA